MSSFSDILMSTFRPQLAIVVYESSMAPNYYLESHDINPDGSLSAGRPLLQETIQDMVDLFFEERQNRSKVTGIIPENLLSFNLLPGGKYKMVWYRPMEERVIHFAAALKIPIAKVWVPAMVYVVERNLSVFAINGNERPGESTQLFHAPFHNVYDNGEVCLGNAKVKKPINPTYSDLMKYWEDLFWLSEFTHLNGDNKTKSDMNVVWRKMVKSKRKLSWSDIDELKPYKNHTLKKLI